MNEALTRQLAELEKIRGTRVIVYCFNHSSNKGIDHLDVPIWYQCLRQCVGSEAIDVVLHTDGGSISAARRIALLLRDFADELCVLVPYKARSAGTLLSLAADKIVLSPLAEFSPLDPYITSGGEGQTNVPPMISAEEVRGFVEMMGDWFDLKDEQFRAQALGLLTQRVFPTTLVSFFRADRYVRRVGADLLRLQLPDAEESTRVKIVDALVSGYWDHGHGITRGEIMDLGLRASAASGPEETAMEKILAMSTEYMTQARSDTVAACNVVLFSRSFVARHVQRWVVPGPENVSLKPGMVDRGSWEKIE